MTFNLEGYEEYYNTRFKRDEQWHKTDDRLSFGEYEGEQKKRVYEHQDKLRRLIEGKATKEERILTAIKEIDYKFDIITYSIVGDYIDLVITFEHKREEKDVPNYI